MAPDATELPSSILEANPYRQERDDLVERLQRELGDEFDSVVAEGAALDLDAAYEWALSLV